MSCDKLTFWPGHCHHLNACIALPTEVNALAESHVANPIFSAAMLLKMHAAKFTTTGAAFVES